MHHVKQVVIDAMFDYRADYALLRAALLATAVISLSVLSLGAREISPYSTGISAKPVPYNQLLVSGNACGPAALLSAFRFATGSWQKAGEIAAGKNDKQRILSLIKDYGTRSSVDIKGRMRWSRRGVNVPDMTAIANEMAETKGFPSISYEVSVTSPSESPARFLRRFHERLERSLTAGLPPVVSLRRFVFRRQGENPRTWTAIDGHFVTIIRVGEITKNGSGFSLTYLDPWGGKIASGEVVAAPSIPGNAPPACIIANFPQASVGKRFVRKGEMTALTVGAVIGAR